MNILERFSNHFLPRLAVIKQHGSVKASQYKVKVTAFAPKSKLSRRLDYWKVCAVVLYKSVDEKTGKMKQLVAEKE